RRPRQHQQARADPDPEGFDGDRHGRARRRRPPLAARRSERGALLRSARVLHRVVDLRRHRSDPAQHHRRAGARPAAWAEGRQPQVTRRAHDLLVNVDMGAQKPADWLVRVKEDTFKADDSMFQNREPDELLAEMDALGVERAVLLAQIKGPSDNVRRFVENHPARFSLGIGGLDLLKPMPTVRALQSLVEDFPVTYAISAPSFWGDGMYPADHAVYFPLYTKACELDLPICLNTRLP